MRSIFPLISHPAVLFFLPWLVLLAIFAALQGVQADASGYWIGVVSSATVFTVFSCTFGALCGALAGSRVRRGHLLGLAPVRSALQVAWESIWPVLGLAVVLQAVGLAIASAGSWGSPGRFPWELIPAWLMMIAFHTILGYGLGSFLPAVASAPTALLLSYVWLGFTWSMSFIPLRYLSGLAISGCCAVYATLPWQAPAAVFVFSLGGVLCIAGLLTLTRLARQKMFRAVGSVALIAGGTSLALMLAQGLGPYPSPPRSQAQLECTEARPATVCLFPEQQWDPSADAIKVISVALQRLDGEGIAVPTKVSGALLEDAPGTISIVYRRDFDESMIVRSLVSSITPERQEGDVCKRDDKDARPALFVSDVADSVLYALATGQQITSPPDADSSDPSAAASTILALDKETRAKWIERVIDALDDCTLPIPKIPTAEN